MGYELGKFHDRMKGLTLDETESRVAEDEPLFPPVQVYKEKEEDEQD